MHGAPSVMFPVGRCVWYGAAFVVLALLGAFALGAWWWLDGRQGGVPWLGLAGAMLWLMWVCFAAWTWRHAPTGHLRWSASEGRSPEVTRGTWHWHSVACPEGTALRGVERVLDLQVVVLLRLHNADALARWIWVERVQDPERWSVLRRALVSAGK